MNDSKFEIEKKMQALKVLSSRRIDEILKAQNAQNLNDEASVINTILSLFKK